MSLARVLLVHNHYRQHGGEDEVVANELALLERRGHPVRLFAVTNRDFPDSGAVSIAMRSVWNSAVYRSLRALLAGWPADVVHFHNTYPLISPAGYWAARRSGAAVVQALHNYRAFCANALLFRGGRPCEECIGRRLPWPGVLHACYRGSRLASGAAAMAIVSGRALGATGRAVDRFIAGSRFAAQKCISGGLPEARVRVSPQFLVSDPQPGDGGGGYALYAGRLAPEKGVLTLLAAWEKVGQTMPLRVAGDGPLQAAVRQAAASGSRVDALGPLPHDELIELMRRAAFVVLPSELYETFGRVGMEALACGTPLLASRIGAVAELVEQGRNGVLFDPGDAASLAAGAEWLSGHIRNAGAMRGTARASYEARFTADAAYRRSMEIYAEAGAAAAERNGRR